MKHTKTLPRKWLVAYTVKYSEPWCADECSWIEHSATVEADTARKARRKFRDLFVGHNLTAFETGRILGIVGRHVSTEELP